MPTRSLSINRIGLRRVFQTLTSLNAVFMYSSANNTNTGFLTFLLDVTPNLTQLKLHLRGYREQDMSNTASIFSDLCEKIQLKRLEFCTLQGLQMDMQSLRQFLSPCAGNMREIHLNNCLIIDGGTFKVSELFETIKSLKMARLHGVRLVNGYESMTANNLVWQGEWKWS